MNEHEKALPAGGPAKLTQNAVKIYVISSRERLLLPLAFCFCLLLVNTLLWSGPTAGLTASVCVWYGLLGLYLGRPLLNTWESRVLLAVNLALAATLALGSNWYFRAWNLLALLALLPVHAIGLSGGQFLPWWRPSMLWERLCLLLWGLFGHLGALALFLPVIWLYAFFDSYALRSQLAAGTAPEDAFLFGLSDMDSKRLGELLRKRHSLIGWALVVVGVYMLYDILLSQLGGLFFGWFGEWLYGLLRYGLPRLVITVLVILLGLWFIRGPKDKTPIDDEIPPFAPPASSAAGACAADPAEARAEDVASDRSAAGNAPEGEEAHRDEQP